MLLKGPVDVFIHLSKAYFEYCGRENDYVYNLCEILRYNSPLYGNRPTCLLDPVARSGGALWIWSHPSVCRHYSDTSGPILFKLDTKNKYYGLHIHENLFRTSIYLFCAISSCKHFILICIYLKIYRNSKSNLFLMGILKNVFLVVQIILWYMFDWNGAKYLQIVPPIPYKAALQLGQFFSIPLWIPLPIICEYSLKS